MVPLKGKDHYLDMISESNSKYAKANAARRYAEMVVDIFLSESIKKSVGVTEYEKMKFYEIIKEIQKDLTPEMTNALNSIRKIGDRGSHYSSSRAPTDEEVNNAVRIASKDLIPLVFYNYFLKNGFFSIDFGPRIFSTLHPSIREDVLFRLIDFRSKKNVAESDLEKNLFHKYVMACYKNGNREKIRRKLKSLYSKRRIDKKLFEAFSKTIENFDENSKYLPIPISIEDSKRNFKCVLEGMSEDAVRNNHQLIVIMNSLLDGVQPSIIEHGLEADKIMHNPFLDFRKI